MQPLILFLVFCQGLGAVIGAVMAVWSELSFASAMLDGKIDVAERAHLKAIGHGLSFGMTLLLLSSLGLVIVEFILEATPQPALTTSYWLFVTLALVVIMVSWALSRRHISMLAGSAIAFTAWWFLVYLTFGQLPTVTFGDTMLFFIVAVLCSSVVIYVTRTLLILPKQKRAVRKHS